MRPAPAGIFRHLETFGQVTEARLHPEPWSSQTPPPARRKAKNRQAETSMATLERSGDETKALVLALLVQDLERAKVEPCRVGRDPVDRISIFIDGLDRPQVIECLRVVRAGTIILESKRELERDVL